MFALRKRRHPMPRAGKRLKEYTPIMFEFPGLTESQFLRDREKWRTFTHTFRQEFARFAASYKRLVTGLLEVGFVDKPVLPPAAASRPSRSGRTRRRPSHVVLDN